MLAPQRKAPQSAFEPIQRYLQEEFLATDNRLDCTKDRTKLWIDVKSQQLLETQGAPERALARTAAEDQMRKFYENITRAVLAVDEKSTRLVLKALGLCPGFEHYEAIVNCLEMAVAIYFLDPETAKKALSENQQTDSVPSA